MALMPFVWCLVLHIISCITDPVFFIFDLKSRVVILDFRFSNNFLRSELYLFNFCLSGKYRWEVRSVFYKPLYNSSLYLIDRNTPAVIHLLPLCLYLLNLTNLKGKCLFLSYEKLVLGYLTIQWSAVITRSDIVRYYMNNYKKCVRISTRLWIHKRHPIPRPSGRVMGCPLRIFWENGPRYNGTALYLSERLTYMLGTNEKMCCFCYVICCWPKPYS